MVSKSLLLLFGRSRSTGWLSRIPLDIFKIFYYDIIKLEKKIKRARQIMSLSYTPLYYHSLHIKPFNWAEALFLTNRFINREEDCTQIDIFGFLDQLIKHCDAEARNVIQKFSRDWVIDPYRYEKCLIEMKRGDIEYHDLNSNVFYYSYPKKAIFEIKEISDAEDFLEEYNKPIQKNT